MCVCSVLSQGRALLERESMMPSKGERPSWGEWEALERVKGAGTAAHGDVGTAACDGDVAAHRTGECIHRTGECTQSEEAKVQTDVDVFLVKVIIKTPKNKGGRE